MKKLLSKLSFSEIFVINGFLYGLDVGVFAYATHLFIKEIKLAKSIPDPVFVEDDQMCEKSGDIVNLK